MSLGGKHDMLVALEQNIESVLVLEDESSMENIRANWKELQRELLKRNKGTLISVISSNSAIPHFGQ